MKIAKRQYWDQLVNFYYDSTWDGGHSSVYDWLEAEYGAKSSTGDPNLTFKSGKHATMFKLRWA